MTQACVDGCLQMLVPVTLWQRACVGGWDSRIIRQAMLGYSSTGRLGGAVHGSGEVLVVRYKAGMSLLAVEQGQHAL